MFLATSPDSLLGYTPKKRRKTNTLGTKPYSLATIHLTNQIRLQEYKREKIIQRQRLLEQLDSTIVPVLSDIDDWYIYHCYFPHDSHREINIYHSSQYHLFLDRLNSRHEQFKLLQEYLDSKLKYEEENCLYSDNNDSIENTTNQSSESSVAPSNPGQASSSPVLLKSLYNSPEQDRESENNEPSSKAAANNNDLKTLYKSILYIMANEFLLMKIVRNLEYNQSLDVDTWTRNRVASDLRKIWWTLTKKTTDFESSIQQIQILTNNLKDILIECKKCRRDHTYQQIQQYLKSLTIQYIID